MKAMNKIIKYTLFACTLSSLLTSCDKFVFGDVNIDYNNNPLDSKAVPHSGADHYVDSLKKITITAELPNPDKGGAFDDWATCLVMFKEGHSHGGAGMMHGNFVYPNAPWRQEQFAIIHNTPGQWPIVDIQKNSTVTPQELANGQEGKNYIRIIGGRLKRWGMCLYFLDRKGQLLNDKILDNSSEYQIFFTVSDVDDKGQPYTIMDQRGTWKPKTNRFQELIKGGSVDPTPIPSPAFAGKTTWEQRAQLTPKIFEYIYRDTWTHDVMGDGAREMFNIKLLPPLTRAEQDYAVGPYDQDKVGLKGHFNFDIEADEADEAHRTWPFLINNRLDPSTGKPSVYTRPSSLLPMFYLSVRVMKCPKGKKTLIPREEYLSRHSTYRFLSPLIAPEYYDPNEAKEYGAQPEWKEVFRFNIPIKVYSSSFDTDPTAIDPNDPFYYYLGKEIGLTPAEALEAAQNLKTHGIGGGSGFGNWFL